MPLWLGLHSGPFWGSLQCFPDPLTISEGLLHSKEEGGRNERGYKGREGKGREREGWKMGGS